MAAINMMDWLKEIGVTGAGNSSPNTVGQDQAEDYSWGRFNFKEGNVVSARSKDRSKIILFVSMGSEDEDLEIVRLAGIEDLEFNFGQTWLRVNCEGSVLVVQDKAAKIDLSTVEK